MAIVWLWCGNMVIVRLRCSFVVWLCGMVFWYCYGIVLVWLWYDCGYRSMDNCYRMIVVWLWYGYSKVIVRLWYGYGIVMVW